MDSTLTLTLDILKLSSAHFPMPSHMIDRLDYLTLRTQVEQVKAIDVGRYTSVLGIVTKHTCTSALGELGVLIVQILWEINHILDQ